MRSLIPGIALGAILTGMAVVSRAATATIEPDDYVGIVSNVHPGATLVTLYYDLAGGWSATHAYSVKGGNWSPTGGRVFGHRPLYAGNVLYHWDNLNDAHACITNNFCGNNFFVFAAAFTTPTTTVEILTTMRGEMAMDPVELDVYDVNGNRTRCRQQGIGLTILNSGVLPPPRIFDPAHPWINTPCGEVIEKKNCATGPGALPGDCDFVVRMRIERRIANMTMMTFGGPLYLNTHANVDRLSFWVP
jgi:hypothetical protein